LVRDRAEIGRLARRGRYSRNASPGGLISKARGVGVIETQVIDEKARQKRLPALRARRGNDEEGRSVVLGRGCNAGRRMLA
jgi:hypothetical protein